MKFKRQRRFHAEVSTASLNDIMFFLLLFFLIISTLGNPNVIRLLLPKSSKSQHNVTKDPVTLSITKDKEYFIENRQVPFEELEGRIQQITANTPEPTIIVRADGNLPVQDLVEIMDIGGKLNVRMVLATEKK